MRRKEDVLVGKLEKYALTLSTVAAITLACGVLANFAAIASNGWKMPVERYELSWDVCDARHKEMDESTRLRLLCDIFPIRNAQKQVVGMISLGDAMLDCAKNIAILGLLIYTSFFILRKKDDCPT